VQVPAAVAQAAMASGVARRPIIDMQTYKNELSARLDPTFSTLQMIFDKVREQPRRVVFAEGEEERVIRAALVYRNSGYGTPVLVGRPERIKATMEAIGLDPDEKVEIQSAATSSETRKYADFLYARQQRKGALLRDCQRMVNQDRNIFAACMVACGDADAMVTGTTRTFGVALDDIRRVIDPMPGRRVFGLSLVLAQGRTVFIADTAVNELPTAAELAMIAESSAQVARRLGHEPRVALLSFSTFGNPLRDSTLAVREAVHIMDARELDFEYEGEMAADVALNRQLLALYPFSRLKEPANVLVMPGLHSANIASKLVQELGGGTVIGPLLINLSHPVQIASPNATVSDLVNVAALAAHDARR